MELHFILVNEMAIFSFRHCFNVEPYGRTRKKSCKKSSSWRILDNGLTGYAKEADLSGNNSKKKKMGRKKKKYDVPLHRAAREEI